jgi:hypothetical protein
VSGDAARRAIPWGCSRPDAIAHFAAGVADTAGGDTVALLSSFCMTGHGLLAETAGDCVTWTTLTPMFFTHQLDFRNTIHFDIDLLTQLARINW